MLTERDIEILKVLCHKVRVLSAPQIARTWWPLAASSVQSALRRIRRLQSQGLLQVNTLSVHPEIPLACPLSIWHPGEPKPDFGPIVYQAQVRWTLPAAFVTTVCATRKAASLFGGYAGRFPEANDATHDLHLAAVFLRKRTERPTVAETWLSEDMVRASRQNQKQKLPDAIIHHPATMAIEFVGRYPKKKLEAFHDFCDGNGMGYELW